MAKKEKNSFVLYYDQCESAFVDLEDSELATLWKDIEAYSRHGIVPEYPPKTLIATHFRAMAAAESRNQEKYAARCETNRRNANKRWESDTTAYNRIRTHASDADSDSEPDNVIDNDPERENEGTGEATGSYASLTRLMPYSSDGNVYLSDLQRDSIQLRCKNHNDFLELMEIMSRRIERYHLESEPEKHYELCMEYMDSRPLYYLER